MKLAVSYCLVLLFWGLAAGQDSQPTPVPIRGEMVVTATRMETRIGDTPANVVVFSKHEIETSAAPTIDDILRQAVGFSIFRRSSSRNANPTTQGVSLRGVGSPTLNELYRSFAVGNVLTLANENLLAEHAKNIEGGISFAGKHSYLRASGFWTGVNSPVANVTLTSTPTLITRQRQNAGSTRSSGVEIEGETRVKQFGFSAGYMFVNPIVRSFPSNRALEGLLIPQVARHQFTFQARYAPSKWTFAVQGRTSSQQFDDDLNLFRLEPHTQIDLFFSGRLSEKLQIYSAIENIFDARYSVGKTPARTVNSPTNFRIGLRWK